MSDMTFEEYVAAKQAQSTPGCPAENDGIVAQAWYCRFGIPCEAYGYDTLAQAEAFAEHEESGGYGLDRGDMFIVAPDSTVLVPADRTSGHGITAWVPATVEIIPDLGEWAEPPYADMESRYVTLAGPDGPVTVTLWVS